MALKDFFQQTSATTSGTVNCSSAAPAFGADAGSAIFMSLTNTNPTGSVRYAVYNNTTGEVVSQGTLSNGNSKAVIIDAQNTPQIVRLQNQSNCDIGGITPVLSYFVSVQGG